MKKKLIVSLFLFILIAFFVNILNAEDTRGIVSLAKYLDRDIQVGKQYLFLIAIDNYKNFSSLTHPVADAKEIRDILADKYYFDEVIELYNESATRANIIKTLTGLKNTLTVTDSLLIYYAGHGDLDKESDTGSWIPVDAEEDPLTQVNWIPNHLIRRIISKMDALHVLLISDSCFSGDFALVGAWLADGYKEDSGATYLYVWNGTLWTEWQKPEPSESEEFSYLGASVHINGNHAVMSAWDEALPSRTSYIYQKNGTVWTIQQKVTVSENYGIAQFENNVNISGDYTIIGAPKNTDNGTNSGAAYIFHRDGATWTEQKILTASDGVEEDRFGISACISGNYAVVGADYDDDNGSDSGSVYIYEY